MGTYLPVHQSLMRSLGIAAAGAAAKAAGLGAWPAAGAASGSRWAAGGGTGDAAAWTSVWANAGSGTGSCWGSCAGALAVHARQISGFDGERIARGGDDGQVVEHRAGGRIPLVVVGHRAADDPAEGLGAVLGDLAEPAVRGEGVLDDREEHGPGGVDVELAAVDLVDLDAPEGLADELGVAEVLGAVRRQRHRAAERGDEPEVDEVRPAPA